MQTNPRIKRRARRHPAPKSRRATLIGSVAATLGITGAFAVHGVAAAGASSSAWTVGASFPLFVTATMHGLTAGTDASSWAFQVLAAAALAIVVALTATRIAQRQRARSVTVPAR